MKTETTIPLKGIDDLELFITLVAERAGMTANPTDKEILSRAAGHLINYQFLLKNLRK